MKHTKILKVDKKGDKDFEVHFEIGKNKETKSERFNTILVAIGRDPI